MSSQGPKQPPITDLNKTVLIARASELLTPTTLSPQKPKASHRLSHLQALEDRLRPDKTQEPTQEEIAAVQSRSEKQTLNLDHARNRNIAFAAKQAQVAGFLDTIRKHITDQKLTPQNVTNAMEVLLKQFDDRAAARKMAVELAESDELAASEVARLEKEPAPSPTAPVAASSNQTTPTMVPSPLEVAKGKATAAKTAAEKAKLAAEKPTDILAEEEGAFRAFVAHTQSHRVLMEAIVFELQFGKKDEELTAADDEVASAAWESVLAGKKARLADVERAGGRLAGIQARVADWNSKMPKALSSAEMVSRDRIVPYEEGESQQQRKERLRQVAGYEPRTEQIAVKAVARDKALKESGASLSLAKQPHELSDEWRAEFEDLGIKPIPKNKQNLFGAFYRTATGIQMWKTIFEDTPTSTKHKPPRRAMLDEGAPAAFPERKEFASKALVPGLERHLKMGVKEGYLVGQKSKATDTYQVAEDSDELNNLMANLKKLRI